MNLTKQVANIRQGRDGWQGSNLVELNGITWNVSTYKNYQGVINCTASPVEVEHRDGFTITISSPFTDKSYRLATGTGNATQKKIQEVQQQGLNRLYELYEAGELPKAAEPLKVGQVLFLEGYEGGRAVVYKVEGKTIYTVNPDKLELSCKNARDIKPDSEIYGIGWYYREGELMDLEEVNTLVNEARQATEERERIEREKAEERERKDAELLEAGRKLLPAIPAGAVSIIVAELEQNESDPYTDYYGSRTIDTVFLAWSGHNRDLFPELRKAADKFEETKDLVNAPADDVEQRQKYSMGAGYFLGRNRYSGWNVKKVSLQTKPGGWGITLEVLQRAAAAGKFLAGTTIEAAPKVETGRPYQFNGGAVIKLNTAKNGIEIYFESKPDFSVLQDLKANGFRWAKWNACWYKIDSPAARAVASKYGTIPGSDKDPAGDVVQAQENAYLDNIAREIAA